MTIDTGIDLERALAISAYQVYLATLIGNAPRYIERLRDELQNPQPGDLVVETSSLGRNGQYVIGHLQRVTGKSPGATVYYVTRLNGETERWVDAKFIKILERTFQG